MQLNLRFGAMPVKCKCVVGIGQRRYTLQRVSAAWAEIWVVPRSISASSRSFGAELFLFVPEKTISKKG